MYESHIQQVGHKLQICDASTGHSVKNIAFVDDAERAKDMAQKLNSLPALVSASKDALELIESIIEGKDWGAIEEIADGLREALALTKGE